MRRFLAAFCAALMSGWTGPVLAQNFGNIPAGDIIGNPTASTGPARPFPFPGARTPISTPNDPSIDSLQALKNALAGNAMVLIRNNETFYVSDTLTIPDKAVLYCMPGGTIARMPSATATDNRPVVKMDTVSGANVGNKLEGCTIDGISPQYGNWWSGLGPNGPTKNVVIRDVTIKNVSYSGVDWQFPGNNVHDNLTVDNLRVVNVGNQGAAFYSVNNSHLNDIKVWSTGSMGIGLYGSIGTTMSHPFANNTNAPYLAYDGPSHEQPTGTSSTSITVPNSTPQYISFTASPNIPLNPNGVPGGQFIFLYSRANPLVFIGGNLSQYNKSTGAAQVYVTKLGQNGTAADWNLVGMTGFMLNEGGNHRVQIDTPILMDNLNSASDGLGWGEAGSESPDAAVVPDPANLPTQVTFTNLINQMFIGTGPNSLVDIRKKSDPWGTWMKGYATGGSATTVDVMITEVQGTPGSTPGPWTLSDQPGPVMITNPYIYRAGLFGLDCNSNMTVIGGMVEEAAERGAGTGRDLGGYIGACHISGMTIKNTGLPAGTIRGGFGVEATAVTFGTPFAPRMVAIENSSFTDILAIDTRNPPLQILGQNVMLHDDSNHSGVYYRNVTTGYQMPPFGATHAFNAFGACLPDCNPHLDGTMFDYGVNQDQIKCYNGGTFTSNMGYAILTAKWRPSPNVMTYSGEVAVTTGCAGDRFTIPIPSNYSTAEPAIFQSFAVNDVNGGPGMGMCGGSGAVDPTHCLIVPQGGIINGHVYAFTMSIAVKPNNVNP